MKPTASVTPRLPGAMNQDEHSESAHGVERAEKDEKILSDAAQRRQRRQKDDRQADDQSPDELVVEPKFAQRPQRRAEPRATRGDDTLPTRAPAPRATAAPAVAGKDRHADDPTRALSCFSVSTAASAICGNLRRQIGPLLRVRLNRRRSSSPSTPHCVERTRPATVFDACDIDTGPSRLITVASTSVIPSAASARVNSGSRRCRTGRRVRTNRRATDSTRATRL